MKRGIAFIFALSMSAMMFGQDEEWTLNQCVDYALRKNISVQRGVVSLEQSRVSTDQARGQWQPSVSFSAGQNFSNNPFVEDRYKSTYSGNYNLGASWTVFNGFRRKYNIEQAELQEDIQETSLKSTEEDVKIAVLTCYLQVLYARESVSMRKNSLETSNEQLNRYKQLYDAGSVSMSDLSQIEAQHVSELYQLTVAQNQLEDNLLQLKQLLRLDLNQPFAIRSLDFSQEQVMADIGNKDSIYEAALSNRPEIASALLNERMADLQIKSAKSGYYPSVNLNASVGTGHNNHGAGDQIKENFSQNVGLSLNYAIADNRERKSAVRKAKLSKNMSGLETENLKDDLKKTIESAYLDAKAAQLSYMASKSNEQSAESTYELTKEKFSLGMKSPFEMLSEKNSLLNARQQTLQSKYSAILNIQVLNIYQGLPIEVE
ncbi:MAG: TolC family protein [Paludibacteraceae bacterium]|nr:TolC family protein [Paludibacteraceae bacterium]